MKVIRCLHSFGMTSLQPIKGSACNSQTELYQQPGPNFGNRILPDSQNETHFSYSVFCNTENIQLLLQVEINALFTLLQGF